MSTPASLAGRPLYEPIAPLLARFSGGLPDAAALSELLREVAPEIRRASCRERV